MTQAAVEDEVVETTGKPAPQTRPKKQPPYAVIVYNDELHTFEYVIEALGGSAGTRG